MPAERFSVEEDERLIALVSRHPLLWNMADSEWKNQLQKGLVWNEVGEQMKKTSSQCKIRWKSIRDHYKKQMKHERDMPTGSVAVKKRAAYWERLRFLEAGDVECRVFSNAQDDTETPGEEVQEDDPGPQQVDSSQCLPGCNFPEGSEAFRKPPDKKYMTHEKSVVKEVFTERRNDRERLKTYLDEIVEVDSEDENDLFFKTVAKTVKKFRPSLVTEAKRKIFAIVMDLEEANEQRPT